MIRVLATVAVGMLTLGCQTGADPGPIDPASSESAVEPEIDDGARPANERETPREELAVDASDGLDDEHDEFVAPPSLPEESSPGPEAETDLAQAAIRDLGAELNAAVGNLEDCIERPPSARDVIVRITATATVRPSGAIIHPSVSGTGLSQLERQCITRRLAAVLLAPLDAESSQQVTTLFEVEFTRPPEVRYYRVGAPDPALDNVRAPLPPRPEVSPSGRPIQDPTARPIQEPTSRPVQEPTSRKVRGPQPRPIDGWEVDEAAKDWR